MSIFEITQIKYAGATYSSSVILDENNIIRIPSSLYLADLAINGQSEDTISNYGYRLNSFFNVLDYSSIDWRFVTQQNIHKYINIYLRNKLSLSESTVEGHIAAISGFYDFVWSHGFLSDPMPFKYNIVDKGSGRKLRSKTKYDSHDLVEKYMETEKVNELLEYVEADSDYLQERNELVIHIGFHLGLRAREIVDPRNLKLSKLWGKNNKEIVNKILIIGKGEKARSVNIPFALKEKINIFAEGRRGKVKGDLLICKTGGEPLNRTFPSKLFKAAADKIEEKYFQSRSYHCLRHTYATNLVVSCYERGHDPWTVVPEQMGHADYTTTLNYIFFEAVLNKRHSLIKKLSVEARDIGRKYKKKGN